MNALLEVRNLSIQFATDDATVDAVKGVSFSLEAGKPWRLSARAVREKA